ncbi:hypothetical protein GCM10027346_17380 [Hymenobacter seoulensis]
MPQRPTLTIPKPCHENWQAMSPAAQGRHCAACSTVVVDFTRMTDAEVVAFLGQPSGGTCGRFRQEQLNRPLVVPLSEPSAGWRNRLLAVAALLGLGVTTAPATAQSRSDVKTVTTVTVGMVATSARPPLPTSPFMVIRGRVLEKQNGAGLPGATVLLKGTTTGVSTSSDGTFELQIPAGHTQPMVLLISSIGFITREVIAAPETIIEVSLDGDVKGQFEEVGLRRFSPRTLWWRITQLFRSR